tara:strand:- start:3244 stop:3699 length:456 start_codon:yes stop_codon:yes gene_type:complete
MVLSTEWLQNLEENFCLEEEQRVEKDFRLKLIMTKLVSLKKSSHFQIVLKNRVVSNDLFTIYRVKNFIKKTNNTKKLYISFVMRKKIGNAVKRNRIKRKLKSIIQKLLKMNSLINLNYTYIILGKEKVYKECHDSVFEKMKKSFKRMDEIR